MRLTPHNLSWGALSAPPPDTIAPTSRSRALTRRLMRLISASCLVGWLACMAACGDSLRPCVEHDECFAREHCASGVCRPYQGRQPTNTR